MSPRDGLLLRGMRWRLGASVLTVLTATVAVATAVLGPLYLHTAGDSLLRRSVAAAAVQARGVTFTGDVMPRESFADIERSEQAVVRSGPAGRYGPPITTVVSGAGVEIPNASAAGPRRTELYARTQICAHLHFVAGGCRLGPGEIVMTARGARQLKVTVGRRLPVSVTGRTAPERMTVTGIVATPDLDAPYWWGTGSATFAYGPQHGPPTPNTKSTDPLISSSATALHVPSHDVPTAIAQIPLASGAVDLANEGDVERIQNATIAQLNRDDLQPSTRLPTVLAAADHQRHVMSTIVAVAAIQLVLLAVWVLGSLLVRSSDARRAEARVARLRGFPPSSMLWVTAAEPGLLCLVGAGLGVAVAWIAVVVAKHQLFEPSATISFDLWTIGALALTLVSIAGALGIGTIRLLHSADLSEGATRRPQTTSTVSLVADAVLVVLAVVALVALATTGALSGHSDPLASVAPGLIALGTAVLAIHVILFACRLGVRVSAGSGRVASFLALRQTSRRPGVLRQGRVLIIALCLACFATAAWSVARANRLTAARFQIGADRVVTVDRTGVGRLESAVARVDPDRRFAMAAVKLQTSSTTLLAVDSRRLRAAASWPSGISRRTLPTVARALAPASAPVLRVPDTHVAVTAQITAHGQAAQHLGDIELGLWVYDQTGGSTIVNLGTLHPGSGTYRADLRGFCPGGCRIAGLGLLPAPRRTPPTAGGVQMKVTQFSPGSAAALHRSGWRAQFHGVRVASGQGPALALALDVPATAIAGYANANARSTPPMVARADHPDVLPATVTGAVQSINNAAATGSVPAQGLDGGSVDVRPVVTSSALPRVGADGIMVDLDLLSRAEVGPALPTAVDEVWLGADAPADAVARLRVAGLTPVRVARSATVFSELQRTAPAVADDFLLVATIAALLVAAASTLGALGATTRERATELSSLEVAGIPRRTLARSLGLESAILILAALCGAAAGILAAALALPSLPSLPIAGLAPLRYTLPDGLLAAVVAIVIAAVALAAAGVTAVLLGRMSPALLRTAPDDVSG